MEAAGRPEVLPLEWQVEGGPLEVQTDPAVEVEARSQNLQTNRTERQATMLTHGPATRNLQIFS